MWLSELRTSSGSVSVTARDAVWNFRGRPRRGARPLRDGMEARMFHIDWQRSGLPLGPGPDANPHISINGPGNRRRLRAAATDRRSQIRNLRVRRVRAVRGRHADIVDDRAVLAALFD